eukprot:3810286-Rhodomonas_salina.1
MDSSEPIHELPALRERGFPPVGIRIYTSTVPQKKQHWQDSAHGSHVTTKTIYVMIKTEADRNTGFSGNS